ncbi:hypothetical protein [Xanthomonas arboricola]|uniref:hypothetical protein n=1 Tax=Xanthomonas arboricola TaxID=56448 RepID=UPI001BAAD74C|nr:hypothetical protein [Xanthomonas arboricola]CAD7374186.1 hypothetical protein X12_000074 [Xanthomonas arboricola]
MAHCCGTRTLKHQAHSTAHIAIRILLRLNPSEKLHFELREQLNKIRAALVNTQSAKTPIEALDLLELTRGLIVQAQKTTQDVLKAEWQRVKQEVAYPDVLMSTIPKPPANPAQGH